jgi:hypothetical protein
VSALIEWTLLGIGAVLVTGLSLRAVRSGSGDWWEGER